MTGTAFSDDELRRAFAARSEGATPRPDCPAPERLWEAARGEGDGEERRALVDHIAGCASCAEDWRLALELQDDTAAELSPAAGAGKSFATLRGWGFALAALLVLAVGLQLLRSTDPDPIPVDPPLRSSGTVEVRSLLEAPLSRAAPRLRWTPGAEGSRYHLLVMDDAFEVLYQRRDLEAAEAVLPAAVIERLEPGAELLWQVEVEGPDGDRVRSPTFTTVLE